ncbi:AHH domain-containing protein [Streptomyces goshikiensis]
MLKPQDHHLLTDKDPEFKAKFEEILKAASMPGREDLTLQSDENIVSVPGHRGKHGEEYHQPVLDALEKALEGKAPHSQEYRDALTGEMHRLKLEVLDEASDLNKIVTRRK